jgi:curved DNA-binding protein CbpA
LNALAKKDYFGILRLPPGASEAVIRHRFKRLARRLHPDVNPSLDAAARFREIREAYEVLTDPIRRAIVDSWFASPSSTRQRPGREHTSSEPPFPGAPRRPMSRAFTAGGDRAWSFGCFALLAFFVAGLKALSSPDATWAHAIATASAVAVVVGFIAACVGERAREWLLWVLSRLWLLWW